MADRPILYSAPMILALLAGRKTQTRRGNHLERLRRFGKISEFGPSDTPGYDWHFRDKEKRWHDLRHDELLTYLPWRVGDRLYVRESLDMGHTGHVICTCTYMADGSPVDLRPNLHWAGAQTRKSIPSIHMPRWASRITQIVTDVRVQRLQDISEEDAISEGVERLHDGWFPYGISTFMTTFVDGREVPVQYCGTARQSYQCLWDAINGDNANSWINNPWVVAYTVETHLRNIDQMESRS